MIQTTFVNGINPFLQGQQESYPLKAAPALQPKHSIVEYLEDVPGSTSRVIAATLGMKYRVTLSTLKTLLKNGQISRAWGNNTWQYFAGDRAYLTLGEARKARIVEMLRTSPFMSLTEVAVGIGASASQTQSSLLSLTKTGAVVRVKYQDYWGYTAVNGGVQ